VRIRYSSTLHSNSALRERAPTLLANLSQFMQVDGAVDGPGIALTMTFPIAGAAE
jgi:hypothetical protein